jgi:spore germination cell wall hydrolase CwlJ-like protein
MTFSTLAGAKPALAALGLLVLGGSQTATAQQLTANMPVVNAVVRSAGNVVTAAQSVVTGSVQSAMPLSMLVASQVSAQVASPAVLDAEAECLATAVYFESRGEPLEGQLAVAEVVLNRARSGKYPTSWCGVVKQRAQFSFVRGGRFPRVDAQSESWQTATAIARIAQQRITTRLPGDVLWYHADYVAPRWSTRLNKVQKIGAHVFYRG